MHLHNVYNEFNLEYVPTWVIILSQSLHWLRLELIFEWSFILLFFEFFPLLLITCVRLNVIKIFRWCRNDSEKLHNCIKHCSAKVHCQKILRFFLLSTSGFLSISNYYFYSFYNFEIFYKIIIKLLNCTGLCLFCF